MTDEGTEVLSEILAVSREQLRWIRAANIAQVREGLEATLTSPKMRRAYEAMDGNSTQAEIARKADASEGSVSTWFSQWAALGLTFRNERNRAVHLVSLQDLGVPIDDE